MKSLILLLVFTALLSGTVRAQIMDEVPRDAATNWLALVDEGKYSESWKSASPFFQKAISEEDWIKKIGQNRKSQGAMQHREFIRGRYSTDPKDLPKGDYFAQEFRTEFDKTKITEMVVVMKDQTGLWQVASYSITTQTPEPMP